MRLPQLASVSSSKRGKYSPLGTRTRKKHKRLDAICENAFNQNRGIKIGSNESSKGDSVGNESALRRSSRVRRTPVILDSSPPPPKKKRKTDKNGTRIFGDSVERVKAKVELKSESSPCSNSRDSEEELASWKSRLRSRVRCASLGMKNGKGNSPFARSKLPMDFDQVKEEVYSMRSKTMNKKKWSDGGKSTIVKSSRPGRIRASIVPEVELHGDAEKEGEKKGADVLETEGDDDGSVTASETSNENDDEIVDGTAGQVVEKKSGLNETPTEKQAANDFAKMLEQNKPLELSEQVKGTTNLRDAEEVVIMPTNAVSDAMAKPQEKHLREENANIVNTSNPACTSVPWKPRIKEGRRCGLCGGLVDGKPPKRLIHDAAGSDHEAYSGSSASEEPNYDIWDGFGDEPGWLGRLLGPINDRYGIAGIWVHQQCAVWSPEVYFAGLGCLKNVRAALCRGRSLKCTRCGRPGATIGCRVDRCPRTYHLPCARANGCIFDHRKFLIACTDHRHLFQPHGFQYLEHIKKLKAKKMKLEMRKLSNDAWRNDLESEEKWLEKCGEDEEFLKRETKRLQRDLLRTAPVYIGGSCSGGENLFEGWESVAGLQDVIRCMKEVVILPLLYPEFFKNLGLTPPRGVLLHGYPGTGKTLVVRALIGSCARGDKRIAYFARKGADCLGKYVGDAERQLRLLFQVAEKSQPSIIFFDEIDGLAPIRTRHQDQTHSSVVSTLLALMDGLKSRGSVIVIGATNRPDAVDPALRRPGRFDREIYFPLPSVKDRAAILALHTRRWPKPVSGSLLQWIAKRTVGFAGADLQALCAQAAVSALKRHCPLQDILSAGEKSFDGKRPQLPAFVVEERDWLDALSSAPPPCSHREAGMAANEVVGSPLRPHLIPCLLQPFCSLLISIYLDDRIWVPPPLSEAASAIKHVIVSAAEQKNLCSGEWSHLVKDLVEESDIENEIVRSLSSAGVLVGEAGSYCCNLSTIVCDDDKARFESGSCDSASPGLLRNICYAPKKKEGCRILIAGDPRSGQKHLASCLLQCFVGSVEIKKIDLATISQEGHGDMTQGMTRILLKCASMKICVVFMPRIDLWAIESHNEASHEDGESSPDDPSYDEDESHLSQDQFDGESSSSCPRTSELGVTEPPDEQKRATQTWNSFVEQVASICVSASLIILATSEVPCPALPDGVRRFFGSDSLSSEGSVCSKHTSPQITVQVDGRFNQDMVMQSAASELSRNLIGQFIQFIHHRLHSHAKSGMSLKDYCEGESDSAKEPDSKILSPENTTVKVPIMPNSRSVKSKSNLLLAITTFGYQILRYPHFAELCWVTSKLREGPCADISGPWKGWPFNSCLIRPNSSFEKETVACISSNIKGKDKFNLVRGLIAVGLSAYRGAYKSLAEVSFEVRKVLELLVRQISAKIQAGKDRYQFISLLSQVAYLEDMVNSWTYSLRSLELDAKTPAIKPIRAGSPNDHQIWVDDPTHFEGESSARTEGFHEFSEPMEGSLQRLTIENFEHIDLNTDVNSSGHLLNTDKTYALQVASLGHLVADIKPMGKHGSLEMESPQKAVSASHAVLPSSTSVDRSGGLTSNEKNSARFDACNPEHYNDLAAVGGVGSSRQTNGFMNGESLVHPNIGACSSGEFTSTEPCGSIKVCNHSTTTVVENSTLAQEDESTADVDVDVSLERSTYLSAESGIICSYRCCLGCIYALHQLVHKVIVKEWEMTGVCWTVEDFHDLVASLSIKLSSAVVKLYNNGGFCSSIEKDLFQSPEIDTCPCKISESNLTIPVECTCHLRSFSSNENSSRHYHLGFNSEFICRDGIFVRADPASEVTFHCKYKTLCLCSLINSIAITNQL